MNDPLELLKTTILQRNPCLFLGAGFSSECTLADGSKVPMSNKLKELIIKEVININPEHNPDEYSEYMGESLQQIYSYAYDDELRRPLLHDLLIKKYSNCTPAKDRVHIMV